jgi:hypothetical protein
VKAKEYLEAGIAKLLPVDLQDAEIVGIQISADGQRFWLCVNGVCIMRIKGISGVQMTDDRFPPFADTKPEGAHGL